MLSVATIASMAVFRISYPTTCYNSYPDEDEAKAVVLSGLTAINNKIRQELQLKPMNLYMSELDRILTDTI